MEKHPLAEVFGFPADNVGAEASRYRKSKLCPFNNRVPNCTKDKAENPLGVCSVFDTMDVAITCPIRFRQNWIIADDAAGFFFPDGTTWTSVTEVRLNDKNGRSAGNIDMVMVAYDDRGRITDFGALEVQSVYISGNIRRAFEFYMEDPTSRSHMDWSGKTNYPRPDYLSSSRKRLAPQLLYKGGILNTWKRKSAVALNKGFFDTLPELKQVSADKADMAWLIYDLEFDRQNNRRNLKLCSIVYTGFQSALSQITKAEAGLEADFIETLQVKLDEKLDVGEAPDNVTLNEVM
jgi:hypothetical protein